MIRWVFGVVKRFALFNVTVIGVAQANSWLFGYDDEFKAWASENRLWIGAVLLMSGAFYATYDWLEESERQKEK